MSLIIASNKVENTTNRIGEAQSAFSWTNHLNQPIKIPPNSEIAVQSLKINKKGTISVSSSTKWYVYFGTKLAEGSISLANTTSQPHLVDLGINGAEEVTIDELALKIQEGLNRGVPTPDTFGQATCVALKNGSNSDFEGFQFDFTSLGNASALDNKPIKWTNMYDEYFSGKAGLTFNNASQTLSPIAKYVDRKGSALYNVAIGETTPLATNGGEFIMDLANSAKSMWAVGLRRCTGNTLRASPLIFTPKGRELGISNHYADFIVYAIQDNIGVAGNDFKIRVYQSEYNKDTAPSPIRPLTMKEVKYYQNDDSDFEDVINWSTNTKFSKIKFTLENELVRVELGTPADVYSTLVPTSQAKGVRFNPVRDTCRNLYPIAFQTNNASNNSYLTVEKWGGRVIPNFLYNNSNNDWWAYIVNNNLQNELGVEVETKPFMDYGASGVAHTYKGISASGTIEYDFSMILREDTTLYTGTQRANADNLFGFDRMTRLTNASVTGTRDEIQTYKSVNEPELISTTSIFVRINNLPIRSYNAGQSRRSQIIYSVPRFATGTNLSVGSLFFESPEKTYLSLDNPNELNLNTINIDIVNENETLATDLQGRTVCALHVRQKKNES
tara:strand:- start:1084 stop:2925 length:1842 start_codon:yes stop_codon:yes gene_type:complete